MKQRSIPFLLLLLFSLCICCGCSSGDVSPKDSSPAVTDESSDELSKESVSQTDDAESAGHLPDTAAEEHGDISLAESSSDTDGSVEKKENVTGIFQGLEGNHTAVFSFDGIETAFHFDEPAVQKILFEAVAGSSYILSYYINPVSGLYVIYEISET